MAFVKMLRSISIGFIFGILAIGLLPFLVIFNWAEILGLVGLETSPLFMLFARIVGSSALKDKKIKPEHKQEHDQ